MPHPIETALEYAFHDVRWLEVALSHRSAPLESSDDHLRGTHNERLEFLGDAVLDLGIRALLFRRYPDVSEGELTRYRSFLASGSTLAGVAQAIRLDAHLSTALRLDDGHPAQRQRALANTLEAILGAIFCDGGFEAAYGVVERLVLPQIAVLENEPFSGNFKSALQEHWQSRYGATPVYEVVGVEGPSHAPYFEMIVRLGEELGELGAGWSKREASQNAARATLERLEREGALAETEGDAGTTAHVGIGSNVGDRLAFLRLAIRELERNGSRLARASSVFETEPVGYADQGWFLNAVIEVETELDARAFHALLKRVEDTIGRRPSVRWGPREIDLDLLLFGDAIVREERLTLPHANLHERRFVLEPFAELAPDLEHPTLRQTIRALLDALTDPSDVRVYLPPDALTATDDGETLPQTP